jgi:hypothetical protein
MKWILARVTLDDPAKRGDTRVNGLQDPGVVRIRAQEVERIVKTNDTAGGETLDLNDFAKQPQLLLCLGGTELVRDRRERIDGV